MSAIAPPSSAVFPAAAARAPRVPAATLEPVWVRTLLIIVALAFLTLFLFVPLASVFAEALKLSLIHI